MITYEITSSSTANLKHSRTLSKILRPEDQGYKESVFRRAFEGCKLSGLDFIKVRGTPNKGQILEVVANFNNIKWEKNRPMFLRIKVNDKEYMAHPSQLKKISKI